MPKWPRNSASASASASRFWPRLTSLLLSLLCYCRLFPILQSWPWDCDLGLDTAGFSSKTAHTYLDNTIVVLSLQPISLTCCSNSVHAVANNVQESRAVERKPHNAALFFRHLKYYWCILWNLFLYVYIRYLCLQFRFLLRINFTFVPKPVCLSPIPIASGIQDLSLESDRCFFGTR